MSKQVVVAMIVVMWSGVCSAHGRMWDPPGRSTMWRKGFRTPQNYDDHSLNCGGREIHHGVSNGQCGICGDSFQDPQPRANEAGGRYGNGIIVKTYSQEQAVRFRIELTVNHKGWMEFKICPNNDVNKIATQTCLDQYVLQRADGTGTKTMVPTGTLDFDIDLVLPAGLTCFQCVVQWKYHAGNDWNCGDDGCCVGCGPQEEFYACADIQILANGNMIATNPSGQVSNGPSRTATTTSTTTTRTGSRDECKALGVWSNVPGLHQWCRQTCPACQPFMCNEACRKL